MRSQRRNVGDYKKGSPQARAGFSPGGDLFPAATAIPDLQWPLLIFEPFPRQRHETPSIVREKAQREILCVNRIYRLRLLDMVDADAERNRDAEDQRAVQPAVAKETCHGGTRS